MTKDRLAALQAVSGKFPTENQFFLGQKPKWKKCQMKMWICWFSLGGTRAGRNNWKKFTYSYDYI